jgi:hypothetical protein
MARKQRVYLVPGFFGFTHMGGEGSSRLVYFGHVRDFLLQRFSERGLEAEVVPVASHPTASLLTRTRDVLQAMGETASGDDADLHLIGHSTGGLDARGVVSARMAAEAPDFVKRVRSVVTVATPHHGTPLADFFHQDRRGETLLRLLYLFTAFSLHRGPRPLMFLAFRLFYDISRAGDSLGMGRALPDLLARMLGEMPPDEFHALKSFIRQVGTNQELIEELTPGKLEAFNRTTPDVPHVRYGSVVTGAPPPSPEGWFDAVLDRPTPNIRELLSLRMLDPDPQLVYGVYTYLYLKSSPRPGTLRTPEPTPEQARLLSHALGSVHASLSDGIVPTRSQLWGELLHVAKSDHIDVLGHYEEPPDHVSWLKSGSRFRSPQFEAAWRHVFDFLVRAPST